MGIADNSAKQVRQRSGKVLYGTILFLRSLTWQRRRDPDFIVIGAQKSGTASLFFYLSQHPNISLPIRKQIHFFDLHFHKGIKWYKSFFPMSNQGTITGEACPYYVFHPLAAERLAQTFPDVKIIALLRHPVRRAYSHFQMIKSKGREPCSSFCEALSKEQERLFGEREKILQDPHYPGYNYRTFGYLERSLYHKQLTEWYRRFDREQILLIDCDEFFTQTEESLKKIYQFLDVSPIFPENTQPQNKGEYSRQDIEMDLEYLQPILTDVKNLERDFGFQSNWDCRLNLKRRE